MAKYSDKYSLLIKTIRSAGKETENIVNNHRLGEELDNMLIDVADVLTKAEHMAIDIQVKEQEGK